MIPILSVTILLFCIALVVVNELYKRRDKKPDEERGKESHQISRILKDISHFDDPSIYSYIMSVATCTLTRQVMEKQGLKPILDEHADNKWGPSGHEAEELGEPLA